MNVPFVLPWDQQQTGDRARDPSSADYRYRILAEGDSWFTLGGLPTSNLLFSLRFAAATVVVNCALPGDTIRHMSEIASNRELGAALDRRFGAFWDAIVLSGGGNDLIDRVWRILRPPAQVGVARGPADYCNATEVQSLLADVVAGYRRIVTQRDASRSPCRGKPTFTHTYAWVTPRASPANFIFVPAKGPWLEPALADFGVPPEHWNSVSDFLLGQLGDAILSLDTHAAGGNALPNFHVVNTRDLLLRADPGSIGPSNDWMNEIHPTFAGYAKLADVIAARVRNALPPP